MIDIEELKQRNNIVDVIDSLVPLKKAGKNYQACCPFHNEKSPSFTVNEHKQFYYCFGCNASGSVIDFVMEFYHVDFIGACDILGGEHREEMHIKQTIQKRPARIRLPMNQEAFNQEEMQLFLTDKCENIQGKYFYNRSQIIYTTDIHKNKVSLAIIDSKYEPIRHYKKQFLYGSCVVFGDIANTKDVYLFECLFNARSFYQNTNSTVICFFNPENLFFIVEDLKRLNKSLLVIAETQETIYQADKLNLLQCFYKHLDNKVDINKLEN